MLSKEARRARLDELFQVKASTEGEIIELLDEEERTESYRDEGATSTQSWVVERYGVATSTARALTHVGTKTRATPRLAGALRAGEISFDKVRAVADVITPRNDRPAVGRGPPLQRAGAGRWSSPHGRALTRLLGRP